jgi:cytoskeletal protein CcmA (bactofilin family)
MGIMKRFGQSGSTTSITAPEAFQPSTPAPTIEPVPQIRAVPVPVPADQASIGKGLVFKGAVTGTGSLFIDGEMLGNIDLPDSRVTVGPNGHVSDGLSICINARDIVVMGRIRGNIYAADLVEIRAEGSLTGNVSARRISIADGAYFKGDINLRSAPPSPVSDHSEMATEVYA